MTSTTLRLSSSGAQVACHVAGDGPLLVLIHGVGMNASVWHPQIDALQKRNRVIAVDLPGHGGSDPLPPQSKLPRYVAWLREAIVTLDIGPANIVGHSMGALIAGGMACTHPELVSRAALLNGVFRRSAAARAAVEARADEIAHGTFDISTPLKRWFGDSETDIAAKTHVQRLLSEVSPEGYATAYRAFAKGDTTYADRFNHIRCPLLALTADGDANSTPEMSHAMAAAAPFGQSVIVKGHRHMVNLTAPEAVNAALKAWLKLPVTEEVPS
ncbi:MAG: alpha/beta hydrolase [Pseudomonadota bacterium]